MAGVNDACVQIRRATADDAACLSALATQVFLDTYATQGVRPDLAQEAKDQYAEPVFAQRLALPDVEMFVAVAEGGGLVGFVDVQHGRACPVPAWAGSEVLRLYVLRAFQGRGLGRALLQRAEQAARGAPVQPAGALWLTAWVGNGRALRFYPRAGFRDVGRTTYVIHGVGYENVVFAKTLRAEAGAAAVADAVPTHVDALVWSSTVADVDWHELASLYRRAPLGNKSAADLQTVFGHSRYRWLVRQRGQLVAAGRALADGGDCSYICDVAVLPEWQGTGLGRQIVQRLVDDSRGYRKIILYSVPGKEGFYRKLGFGHMLTAMAIFRDRDAAIARGHLAVD